MKELSLPRSRRLSVSTAKAPLMKYMRQSGIASNVIVIGSGVGVNVAVNKKHRNTAVRQGFRIDLPDTTPSRLRATKNNGNTKAIPNIKSISKRNLGTHRNELNCLNYLE